MYINNGASPRDARAQDDDAVRLDALVVGAGPAGIGTALALAAVDGLTFGVLERGRVGQSFRDWPAAQTFLTPSFTGNGFGATDLNAIHPETSPAFSLGVDYPTGPQYANYLRGVVKHFRVPVMEHAAVEAVRALDDGFELDTERGPVRTRSLVWAGGEFGDPRAPRLPGAGFAVHSSTPEAWGERGGAVVVIGGYESGVDIACHHIARGATVTIIDPDEPWDQRPGSDPSFRLAPRSRMRLRAAFETGRLHPVPEGAVAVKVDGDGFAVRLADGRMVRGDSAPIAATGFGPGLGPVAHLFEEREDGWPLLDEDDGSTLAPGLFLSGPSIRHGGLRFCFVYKFRQRFAHIARRIGERAGKDTSALEAWRAAGMLTDDLSCCGVECEC